MEKKQKILLIGVVSIIACCLLSLYGVDRAGAKVVKKQEEAKQAQQKKEQDQALTTYNKEVDGFYQKIQAVLNKQADLNPKAVSVSFYDISSGKSLALNGDNKFLAGSTTKVGLAIEVADKIAKGEMSGSDTIYYHKEDYEEGTGYLVNHRSEAKAITVDKLLEYMLVYSDNIATNMLYRTLGGNEKVRNYIKGTYISDYETSDNLLSTNQAIQLLKVLYENKNKNSYYDKYVNWLKNTDFHERLETDQTKGVVAHKIGSIDDSIHDIGIFYTNHPYMLAVMTTGMNDATTNISKLSDEIYNLMVNEYPQKPTE